MANTPVSITITGATGNIGYTLLFRIASDALLGPEQRVNLCLLKIPPAVKTTGGTVMELFDSVFPTLGSVGILDDAKATFGGASITSLVSSMPRKAGMERADLLSVNGGIFGPQGEALNAGAVEDIKVLVVGNPASTNAFVAAPHAPDIPSSRFTAMTRLNHNRALAQPATRTGYHVTDIGKVAVWGNHSSTQYPDLTQTTTKDSPIADILAGQAQVENDFIPTITERGVAIIDARGISLAASTASAAIDRVHDRVLGISGSWTSSSVMSDDSYGVPEDIISSFLCAPKNGEWKVVQGLEIDDFSRAKTDTSAAGLVKEKSTMAPMGLI